jgi:hypothetical protein
MVFVPDDFSQTYVVTHWTSPSTAGQVSPFLCIRHPVSYTDPSLDIRRPRRNPKLHKQHSDTSRPVLKRHPVILRRLGHRTRSDGLHGRAILRDGRFRERMASPQWRAMEQEFVHVGWCFRVGIYHVRFVVVLS